MPARLLNRAATKRFILDAVLKQRPGWRCTRVSSEAIEVLDAMLRSKIKAMVDAHPCGCGKTFRP